ncbi:hypothetical protein LIER_25427 [Lithospermum erythrorhizon]|uniref:SWIM-type domain-containing protein n=1 Tax=Lithospermum erythrorhizon TaxID=34254 RepID=A0AAV3R610_LITER
MVVKKVIGIWKSGGEFEANDDGILIYKGGDAHAMEIDNEMRYEYVKLEISEMFNLSLDTITIKYFLPRNNKTLITISNDKDLKRMIEFYSESESAEIYVITEPAIAPHVSNMFGSRSTLSEAELPLDAPPCIFNHVEDHDINRPHLMFDANFCVDNTNNADGSTESSHEHPVPASFTTSSNEKLAKSTQQWKNVITGIGQRFNSIHDFRESLKKYAIANQFAFKYKKNDTYRLIVKCKAEGCPWRIYASKLATTPLIFIRKMDPTHTCEGSVVTTGQLATRSWVASIIKDKVRAFPNYKPKDIVSDIKQEHGIQLTYYQAWRGKEIAKEQLQGSYKEAYSQLPVFCEKIMESNPGSLATFATKENSSFHRLFVAFHASLYGFEQGCRPLLFLNSIILKSKYQGTLLAATAADGNDEVFPVAFAVVDSETDENWHWFLQQLKTALSVSRGITFVSDGGKGLKESLAYIFQNEEVYHGYCLHYLSEQLIHDLKGQLSQEAKRLLIEDLYAAAYAPTPEDFQRALENIKRISLEAYYWVLQNEPAHWANAFFQGIRYNHMTSNFGELLYSWASDADELPITQMVDAIRGKITELICNRKNESNQWLTRLTPVMEEKLQKESLKVHSLQGAVSVNNKYEVRGETIEIVDVDNSECSCKGWQISGMPCCHTVYVISCLHLDVYEYCARYFTTDNYRLTYSQNITPIPHIERPNQKNTSKVALVTPPPSRRPPGRPTTKKTGKQDVVKRPPKCSRCKGKGHNKSACKELSLEG